MIKDYILITLRNLRTRKIRSWLTMIGIFIGIAAVVSLISLGQGLEKAVTEVFAGLGTDKLIIQAASSGFGPPGSLAAVPLAKGHVDLVQGTQGVEQAVSRLLRGISAEYDDKVLQNFAVSMPEDLKGIKMIEEAASLEAEEGRLLKPGDKQKVVLGNDFMADSNGFGKRIRLREKVAINKKDFEVVGIAKKMSSPFGNEFFLLPEDTLRELVDEHEEVDIIFAKISPGYEPKNVAETLERKLRRDRGVDEGEEDFTIETPEQVGKAFGSIILVIQIVVIGIAGISLIVGGIGIMNTMFTAVLERRREIGIMKAIGATNYDIIKLFMIEAGLLGMAGGAVGIIIGVGMSKFVEAAGKSALGTELLQAHFSWYLIGGALMFSFIAGVVSGALPALQAAKMHPVDALRK